MKTKRVLHITDGMNRGGIETFIMNVYRSIDRDLIQFDFLISFPDKCDYEDEILKLGGRIYRTTPKKEGIVKFIRNTNKLLKHMPNYEVVHIHVSSLASALSWILTKVRKAPVRIFHSHNTQNKKDLKSVLRKIGQGIVKYNSEYLCACSREAGEFLFGSRQRTQFITINNGIDSNKFFYDVKSRNLLRSDLNLENKLVIGHVGRFNEQKNHEFIIEIFDKVNKKDNNTILLLVGKGELESKIRKKVKLLNLEESVLFLGLRDDINKILNGMDIFLMPSFHEGLPVVGVEAQATGIKCFMSDSITREVDIAGLVEFINLDKSPEFWAERILKSKGYDRCNKTQAINDYEFDIKQVVQKLSNLYEKKEAGKAN